MLRRTARGCQARRPGRFAAAGEIDKTDTPDRVQPRADATLGGDLMGNQVRDAGTVSIDTGAVLIIDPMYLMTDADHDAGRTPEELAPRYDAVPVGTRRDGVFPV